MRREPAALIGVAAVLGASWAPSVAGGRAPAHAARTTTVELGEYFYRPATLRIAAGDRVRFVNVGKIEHTVADSAKDGTVRARIIRPRPLKHGRSQTVAFAKAGTVYYLCTFHPTLMKGRIIVR